MQVTWIILFLFFSWAGEDAPKILKIFILTPLSLIKTRTTLSCRLQFSNQPRLFLALKHASFSLSKTPAFVPFLCNWCGDGSFELFPRRLLQCRSRRIFAGKERAEAWRPFPGRGLARFPQWRRHHDRRVLRHCYRKFYGFFHCHRCWQL